MAGAEQEDDSSSPSAKVVESIDRGSRGDYRIVFSDGSALFVPPPVLPDIDITTGDTVESSKLETIRFRCELFKTNEKALELLARREHSTRQLIDKLRRRGHSEESIERAVENLQTHGYLDDRRFACAWITDRLRRRNEGRAALLAGLRKSGVSQETAQHAMDQTLDEEHDRNAFENEVSRLEGQEGLSIRRIARRLGSRGFPSELIADYVERRSGPE